MKLLKVLIPSLFVFGLTACTAPNSLSTQTQSNGSMSIQTKTNNPVLLTEIGIDRINTVDVGNLKKVAIAIKNQRFNDKHFFYKIVWVDAQGIEVNPEGSIWKPIDLTGREIKSVQSLAPNPSAVDTVIYLKK
ncbi:DUF1425 domain-containing protein [Acinetobacter nectaris]|uniref:DUF1425 domain-containing protein n=2 Tax=Acinetobacter nectaris TaxID=1219382 RepID=UPI001F34BF96|nr:DUF1425 domain-containing protein [Acinetobacter nectaris]MCF8999161.1 DUF1425 domain-containing protein [Acinetobacter nectaris]MCF9026514.1 DUF1425 domain-containing protein [Acinetobacter nectaris]MCF9046609.1 DUF1425 domain-containing protein [Acinetobacter nectaris]